VIPKKIEHWKERGVVKSTGHGTEHGGEQILWLKNHPRNLCALFFGVLA